eukprot:gnl/MRDRNA2_/MRDRNA2_99289_c0_seq1.p1 gnl/MRDRNA2_/MRDRNA2_99289_c0~~gnl/MRDRNA2_/MRDRNA2_99289_c0_seq1.p1  ORF type:complete len:154 (+),score=34.45 gnl/MRDRNA2_/MRDRNA2_99289_c0_seq1:64-525(+)
MGQDCSGGCCRYAEAQMRPDDIEDDQTQASGLEGITQCRAPHRKSSSSSTAEAEPSPIQTPKQSAAVVASSETIQSVPIPVETSAVEDPSQKHEFQRNAKRQGTQMPGAGLAGFKGDRKERHSHHWDDGDEAHDPKLQLNEDFFKDAVWASPK